MSTPSPPSLPPNPLSQPLARFLLLLGAGVLAMMVLGAATRLTDSGLSITEWQPLRGIIPPLSRAYWQELFALYRKTPEYRAYGLGMTLAEFKTIFWWEYAHRLAGRALGLGLLVGLALLGWKRALTIRDALFLLLLFALGGLQGLLGWWMVKSGLAESPNIAPYRLSLHLSLALLLLLLICRRLEQCIPPLSVRASTQDLATALLATRAALCLALCVFVSGALVAALEAGRIHGDWPYMTGKLLPEDYRMFKNFWQNALQNPAAAQFHHRMLAYSLLAVSAALFLLLKRFERLFSGVRVFARALLLLPLLQAGLGAAVLLAQVPILLALAHQVVAVAVLSNLYLLSRRVARARRENI